MILSPVSCFCPGSALWWIQPEMYSCRPGEPKAAGIVNGRGVGQRDDRADTGRRLKLFNIGALVRVSVRRIKIAMASACPYQNEFALAHLRLTATAH
jgi:hypothetical protein